MCEGVVIRYMCHIRSWTDNITIAIIARGNRIRVNFFVVKNVITHYLWSLEQTLFFSLISVAINKRCEVAINIRYTYVHGIDVIEAMLLIVRERFFQLILTHRQTSINNSSIILTN